VTDFFGNVQNVELTDHKYELTQSIEEISHNNTSAKAVCVKTVASTKFPSTILMRYFI
jgi:hypothetical protein